MSIYGPIFHRTQLARAVRDTLRTWAPAYLAAVADQEPGMEPGDLPAISSWALVGSRRNAPEMEPPSVLITTRGLARTPERDGRGVYDGWFAIAFTVDVEVGSPEQDRANEVAGLYCAALRTALIQQPSLGGLATNLAWMTEDYGELGVSEDDESARATAGAAFLVHINNLVTAGAGPSQPPEDPLEIPEGDPEVTEVLVNAEAVRTVDELLGDLMP